jgi:V/A-type H+-transporting ATPase subunit F
MYKVGVIGDKDSILGFKVLGMEVFPVVKATEAEELIDKLAKEHFAIIFITEQIAIHILKTIDKHKDRKHPALVPIPGNGGSLGLGIQRVKESVERAVGADILFKDKET